MLVVVRGNFALTRVPPRAILTRYKANRSFVEWSQKMKLTTLDYEPIKSYTEGLFESYMTYKQLLNLVQDVLNRPEAYEGNCFPGAHRTLLPSSNENLHSVRKECHNAIPIDVSTLVAVRAALRVEMNKIVTAVSSYSTVKRKSTSPGTRAD